MPLGYSYTFLVQHLFPIFLSHCILSIPLLEHSCFLDIKLSILLLFNTCSIKFGLTLKGIWGFSSYIHSFSFLLTGDADGILKSFL